MFAGSSHTKYTKYFLEGIVRLELESSQYLREAILRGLLVNLSGRPGGFSASDFIQEYFNRLLEAVVERKGAEFGAHFIRNVISRNLHHFARIKLDLRCGVGLTQHSGRHSEPHSCPELRRLLNEYRDLELHYRRPGRFYPGSGSVIDNFSRGVEKLRAGILAKWIKECILFRNMRSKAAGSKEAGVNDMDGDDEDDEDDDELEREIDGGDESELLLSQLVTLGCMEMIDGHLVIETADLGEVDAILAGLQEDSDLTEDGN